MPASCPSVNHTSVFLRTTVNTLVPRSHMTSVVPWCSALRGRLFDHCVGSHMCKLSNNISSICWWCSYLCGVLLSVVVTHNSVTDFCYLWWMIIINYFITWSCTVRLLHLAMECIFHTTQSTSAVVWRGWETFQPGRRTRALYRQPIWCAVATVSVTGVMLSSSNISPVSSA